MRYLIIILTLLTIPAIGQGSSSDLLEKRRVEIEKMIESNLKQLVVLVKVKGKVDLEKVMNEDWPEDIETTYNILKGKHGQIIYIGEFPTSESGDWTLGLKHFYSDNGQLVAFQKSFSYFNDNCGNGIVVEDEIELFDNQFKVIKTTKSLTDKSGKTVKQECAYDYNYGIVKRATVKELTDLKRIRE